jgi:hypothetical protein
VLDAAIDGKRHFLALASNGNLNNALYIILFEVKVFLAKRLPTGELQ